MVNVVLTWGCFREGRQLWRVIAGSDQHKLMWMGVCAGCAVVLPILDCMQAGQLGIAILYLLMLGSRLVLEGRSLAVWFLGGVALRCRRASSSCLRCRWRTWYFSSGWRWCFPLGGPAVGPGDRLDLGRFAGAALVLADPARVARRLAEEPGVSGRVEETGRDE